MGAVKRSPPFGAVAEMMAAELDATLVAIYVSDIT